MRRKVQSKDFKEIIRQKMRNNWNINNWTIYSKAISTMLLLLYLTIGIGECQQEAGHPSISQISPKSSSHLNGDIDAYLSASSPLFIESTIDNEFLKHSQSDQGLFSFEENETRQHNRIERSAQPILNENFPKTGPNDVHTPEGFGIKEAAAGRYFQYNIKPTGTYENLHDTPEHTTQRLRAGKTLISSDASSSSSFLLNGDLRQLSSGSLINPTSSTVSPITLESATMLPHKPRQNPNPDIQDIITGIVKLLNGNVNVHANTQGVRRPTTSRINNRGPPRISDVPPLPIEYDVKKSPLGSSIRPPPYPFDRPERPFITGVPIPEQIVPYRPGFVSNRPPWHRNKPRPPITTTIGGRLPINQYKPMPPNEIQTLSNNEQTNHAVHEPQKSTSNMAAAVDSSPPDAPNPTDSSYDSDFSSEDSNVQYIEVSDNDSMGGNAANGDELLDDLQPPPSPSPSSHSPSQMDDNHKKKPQKNKNTNEKIPKKPNSNEYSTVIETSSEVNTVVHTSSSYIPMPMDVAYVEPSTEEVIFMTTSRTPTLEIVTTKSTGTTALINESPSASASAISNSITSSLINNFELESTDVQIETTIKPSPSNIAPSIPSTAIITSSIITTTTTTTTTKATLPTNSTSEIQTNLISTNKTENSLNSTQPHAYQPRPGIVLDDPEFKPGGRPRPQRPQHVASQIQPTRHQLPPGYGEIFDVTLSAIQGPGTVGGSQQTINIKPYGSYGSGSNGKQGDIIVSASGEDGFVSIDGKRTYINLFGDPTDAPTGVQPAAPTASNVPQFTNSGTGNAVIQNKNTVPSVGAGYGVSETEIVELGPNKSQKGKPVAQTPQPTNYSGSTRPHYRQRPTQPPVRIDTCIVGDDSTCDQAQHEHCKTESGVSSCHCRPGYSRRKHREPCRKVISFHLGMRVDRIYEHRIVWDKKLLDRNSEPYGQLSYESIRAIDSAMSMTPYSDEFMEARVNNIYRGDPNLGGSGVFVNMTIKLDESVETLRPNLRTDVQKHLLGVLHRRNNNIGNSVLYVSTPEGAVSALHDLDECQSYELNDCHPSATCTNSWGSFRCACEPGFRDPWADQPQRAGRDCQTCPEAYCNNHGTCSFNEEGNQICTCDSTHYGGQCEIDGEVLGVAIGASVAAVIIIVLTLICLIMWSRRWQREQKNALGSPVFGYMNTAPLKSAGLAQAGYQVTLEDRMRWAQIADVMAQTNHYGAEPIGPTRPSSALFAAYPNLQAAALGMGTLGGMSMQSTLQMHQNASMAPPVPLPRRLGLSTRANGMRTLENSSSSEEEDRTDLLGRNFQVPRPKSRSNSSIANQSGIYYDVDYEPSGNGIGNTSVDHLYGSQNQSSSHSHTHSHSGGNSHGIQGIPMSTYTSGRTTNSYYMK